MTNTVGWYIVKTIAPPGTFDAGKSCWVVMCNGEWQQGFPATCRGLFQARVWGLMGGHGWLPVR